MRSLLILTIWKRRKTYAGLSKLWTEQEKNLNVAAQLNHVSLSPRIGFSPKDNLPVRR